MFGWRYFMKMNAPFSYALFSAKLVNYLKAWWAAGQRLNFQLIDWKTGGAAEPIFQRVGSKAKWSALIISRAAVSAAGVLLAGLFTVPSVFFLSEVSYKLKSRSTFTCEGEDAPVQTYIRLSGPKFPALDVNVRWVAVLGENWMIMKLSLTAAVAQRIPKWSSYVLNTPPPPKSWIAVSPLLLGQKVFEIFLGFPSFVLPPLLFFTYNTLLEIKLFIYSLSWFYVGGGGALITC